MGRFIELEGIDGTIMVEIDETEIDGLELVKNRDRLSSLTSVLTSLIANGKAIIERTRELAPNEFELSFGIKGGFEAGTPIWGLAKASGEGSINIKMKWTKK